MATSEPDGNAPDPGAMNEIVVIATPTGRESCGGLIVITIDALVIWALTAHGR